MRFTSDPDKEQYNIREHRISFEPAKELLRNGRYLKEYDIDHSDEEDRYRAIGMTSSGVIVVIYTVRHEDETRIISAWRANRNERRRFYSALQRGAI